MNIEDLLPPYPNTVFRFRPYTPLSLKELLYSEVYFSSRHELNDPYDTRNPSYFQADFGMYKRLLTLFFDYKPGIGSLFLPYKKYIDIDSIANCLAKENMHYHELVAKLNSKDFENTIVQSFDYKQIPEATFSALTFIKQFRSFIYRFLDRNCYVISFTKNCVNPVMWSHYADYHRGFCTCFTIVNQSFKRDVSVRNTKYGRTEYTFENVNYAKQNIVVDGFYSFPGIVYGKEIDNNEIEEYWKIRKQSYLTKYINWQYEEEVRLIYDDWFPDRFTENGVEIKSGIERLFHYEIQQLTGIIFGAKMNENERAEVKEAIITRRKDKILNDCHSLFLFYEALESNSEYEMLIRPIEGLDALNRLFSINDYDVKKSQYLLLKEHYQRNKA